VREEFERLNFRIPIWLINDFAPEQNILLCEGIIFCTYKSLIAKSKTGERRIDQIMRWLGNNGLEIFDECHRAKHAFADENGKATQTGAAVWEVQSPGKYPDVRVFIRRRQPRVKSGILPIRFVWDCGAKGQASRSASRNLPKKSRRAESAP
jgi:hypothetical protein